MSDITWLLAWVTHDKTISLNCLARIEGIIGGHEMNGDAIMRGGIRYRS
jgi:hypothetical protein